jgi:hypothetical protein
MHLSFPTRRLRDFCAEPTPGPWLGGVLTEDDIRWLKSTIANLEAARALTELPPPGARLATATLDSVEIVASARLTLVCHAAHASPRLRPDGTPDWEHTERLSVDEIRVI